ncbi:hypothetical protein GGI12_006404 [Dipsacomyces acuminosporus]|nr:hypothetical protein GGI12_006404 [Dipsacomyces acuminosporus]
MDGWLTALFAVDADGQKVHGSEGWAIDWNQVPSGVDLQRVSSTSKSQCWNNLYSGFVGVQQLSRSTEHSRSRTLHGEELESALGIAHDRSSTLTDSNDILGYSRSDGQTGFTPRQRSATTYDPQTVPTFGSADPLEFGHNVHAIAPLIGWALDKMH